MDWYKIVIGTTCSILIQQYLLPDTGNLQNNTPPIDEFDEGKTVSTFHALHFYSCISISAAAINIFDITQYSASSIYIRSQYTPLKRGSKMV